MKDKIKLITMIILLIGLGACVAMAFTGCKNFDVVQVKDWPDECNICITTMKYAAVAGSKAEIVGVAYEKCIQALEAKRLKDRENHCSQLLFKNGIIDKSNYVLYTQYLECSAKK